MNLSDTLKAVKDERLNLEQLENYHIALTHFKTDLALEISKLKKARALFLMNSEEKTAIGKKMAWEVSEGGQRLIELEGYMIAVPSELSSLRSRIYANLPRL